MDDLRARRTWWAGGPGTEVKEGRKGGTFLSSEELRAVHFFFFLLLIAGET